MAMSAERQEHVEQLMPELDAMGLVGHLDRVAERHLEVVEADAERDLKLVDQDKEDDDEARINVLAQNPRLEEGRPDA